MLSDSGLHAAEIVRNVTSFPSLPANSVTSRKHKSRDIAIWWMKKHLVWANRCWQLPFRNRFLTFRLCRNGVLVPPDSSFHFRIKQLLQTALCRHKWVAPPCRHSELIEQTLLFRIYAVSGPSPVVSDPGCHPSRTGSTRARDPSDSDPQPMEAGVPSPMGSWLTTGASQWGLNMVPAILVAHVPRGTLEWFPEGLCPVRSWPEGRRMHQELLGASFPCLVDRDPWLPLCC